jgi:N-formylglutamate deformylase
MSNIPPVQVIVSPPATDHDSEVPVVFDSPHSGTAYPADFAFTVPHPVLRMAEDTHVEKLYAAAPSMGATLIAAQFPRSYIDCNRSLLDIDQALLTGPWPGPVNASRKTEKGIGLVWRKLDSGEDIYDRQLSVAEVQLRIASCYSPYHKAVRDAINRTHRHYGAVWHLNCHSMPAVSGLVAEEGPGKPRADFVLGDRDGSTCAPEFTTFVAMTLRGFGYEVKVNDPYKGVELVRAYSDPAEHRHSLQIEVNRKLYMDERTREANANFAQLQSDISRLIGAVARFARAHAPAHRHNHDCAHDHHGEHGAHHHNHDDGHKH